MLSAKSDLGIYIHWPYCSRICPYCDFNVYKNKPVNEEAWKSAFLRDLRYWSTQLGPRSIQSIYFGGGTPSLAAPSIIDAVINEIGKLWTLNKNAEITIEANPSDAEVARFDDFSTLGVNRLSLGIQSFNDHDLQFLGRNHNAAMARNALTLALSTFNRTSLDLIYALPNETPDKLARTLKEALAFGVGHLSPYQLTIESGTAFERAVTRKTWAPPNEDLSADLFEQVQSTLCAAGLPAYEISNHARPGEESIHNLIYWHQNDYLGIGPGAHGRVNIDQKRFATVTEKNPNTYIIDGDAQSNITLETLTPEDILVERVTMGLRIKSGITLSKADQKTLGNRAKRLLELERDGLIINNNWAIRATPLGARVLNSITTQLLS